MMRAYGVLIGLVLLISGFAGTGLAGGQTPAGTAFSYQGRLTDGGAPANGSYDLRFTLFDAATGAGGAIGAPVLAEDVTVTSGVFTVMLDFGATAFSGNARWLEIAVRPGASTSAHTARRASDADTGAARDLQPDQPDESDESNESAQRRDTLERHYQQARGIRRRHRS